MRLLFLATPLLLVSCARTTPEKELDPQLIKPAVDRMRLRTDGVGERRWREESAFVLVDAENTSGEDAYVTLTGELMAADKTVLTALRPQSLYVPARASRTFALVDVDRKPRPTASSAKIVVRSALVAPTPLPAHVEDLHVFPNPDPTHPGVIAQAWLVNDADRVGQIVVTGAFHDGKDRPMTRPFRVVLLGPRRPDLDPTKQGTCPDLGDKLPDGRQREPTGTRCAIQFIGPPGSVKGTIFLGDVVY
ncbi:MAG: hypothetical protein KF773_30135 [Deltaproteobacteria bacterium]|nr:hypothetical protein [Deltaproteobacteria bacterium]MCW5804316.1 hypothetical protein [Deltaproteobacteria bacterium]